MQPSWAQTPVIGCSQGLSATAAEKTAGTVSLWSMHRLCILCSTAAMIFVTMHIWRQQDCSVHLSCAGMMQHQAVIPNRSALAFFFASRSDADVAVGLELPVAETGSLPSWSLKRSCRAFDRSFSSSAVAFTGRLKRAALAFFFANSASSSAVEACFLAGSFAPGFRFSPAFTSSPNL